ncbi:MAG: type VI secretion system domain-containing protein, partial [Acidobacteria bacterium]|nr:type VI secretion system domain-containing protein [Acidobacteriota bacterium]
PSTEARRTLRQMLLDGQWQELLEVAEEAMAEPCGRAWLDLQRYVVRASTELGYAQIAGAIRSELRALIQDIPSLTTLVLMDDTPTANPETQAWIRDEVAAVAAAAATAATYYEPPPAAWDSSDSGASSASGAGEEPPPDAYQLALDAVKHGRFEDGIAILVAELGQEASGRGRFQRHVQIAQVCMANGHAMVALPILERLLQVIDRHGLEEWESADLVAHALALLHGCLVKLNRPPEERRPIYERLCRLSPLQALAAAH